MTSNEPDLRTDGGLLLLSVIWGVNFTVVKAVLEYVEPLGLNALRFPLACAVMVPPLLNRRGPLLPPRSDLPRLLALAVLGNVAYQMAFVLGIDGTLAGNASLILASSPVWTVILSTWLGHERVSSLAAIGVTATLGGVALVVVGRGDAVGVEGTSLTGDLLMLLAALLWAVYTVGARGPIQRHGPLRVTAWTLWFGTPFLVVAGLPTLVSQGITFPFQVWAGVAYSGVLSVGVAYLIWYRGVQRIGNARTAVFTNLVPVAALVTAWIWLGEVPGALQLVGAGVILAGVSATRVARVHQSPEPKASRWRTSGNS